MTKGKRHFIGELNVDKKTGEGTIKVEKEVTPPEKGYVLVPTKDFENMMKVLRMEKKWVDSETVDLQINGKTMATVVRHEPHVVDICLNEDASRYIEQTLFPK